jgi:oligosaccharide repeat unit polymerase
MIPLLDSNMTSLLLVIDGLLLCHFLWSYFRHSYQRGYVIDFWHGSILIGFVLPSLIMYPLAGAEEQRTFIGETLWRIQPYVNTAFLISAIGYIATYAGFYLYRDGTSHRSGAIKGIAISINRRIAAWTFKVIQSSPLLVFYYGVAVLGALVLYFQLYSIYGLDLNVRLRVMADEDSRPLFNFMVQSYTPLVITFLLVRYLKYPTKIKWLLMGLSLVILEIPFGVRGAYLAPIMTVGTVYAVTKRRQLRLSIVLLAAVVFITLALLADSLRRGALEAELDPSSIGKAFLYGNNLSDIRDFGWILSFWNEDLLYGKSYLAGALSFIPRSFSEFRQVWAISVYTNALVGLPADSHGGLRPGRFGEPYLNFGLAGVIFVGVLGGYVMRVADTMIKRRVEMIGPDPQVVYALTVLVSLLIVLYITASSWQFYVTLVVISPGMVIGPTLKGDLGRVRQS